MAFKSKEVTWVTFNIMLALEFKNLRGGDFPPTKWNRVNRHSFFLVKVIASIF